MWCHRWRGDSNQRRMKSEKACHGKMVNWETLWQKKLHDSGSQQSIEWNGLIVLFLSGFVSDRGYLDAPIEHHVQDRPPDIKSELPKRYKRVTSLIIHYEAEARPEVNSNQQRERFKRGQGMNKWICSPTLTSVGMDNKKKEEWINELCVLLSLPFFNLKLFSYHMYKTGI